MKYTNANGIFFRITTIDIIRFIQRLVLSNRKRLYDFPFHFGEHFINKVEIHALVGFDRTSINFRIIYHSLLNITFNIQENIGNFAPKILVNTDMTAGIPAYDTTQNNPLLKWIENPHQRAQSHTMLEQVVSAALTSIFRFSSRKASPFSIGIDCRAEECKFISF